MANEQSAGKQSQAAQALRLLSAKKLESLTDTVHIAWPIADEALTTELLDLVQQASHYRQLKKGANEGTHTMQKTLAILYLHN